MNPTLPPALTAALNGALEGVPRKALVEAARALSAGYRDGQTSKGLNTPTDALAYALARMPATYAACAAAFARLVEVMPGFAPITLLDAGAGTGAASWAACAAWPGIAGVTMLDANPALRALAGQLAEQGLPSTDIAAGDLVSATGTHDLVVASYVLAEMSEAGAATAARGLWQRAGQVLVLVEPGTPQGFARIRAARAALIAAGAHVAAPCTHDKECPMGGDDWCHFSQRLPRSRDHMLLKDASVPFEDERYAYVAVTRDAVARGARILAPPLESKPGLTFKLCDETGLRGAFVATRDKDEYPRVRKRVWGDLF